MVEGIWIREFSSQTFKGIADGCSSPPAIVTLLECQLNCPSIFEQLEVYVDGGIRRGHDILKCMCLGATAVGMGRPFLFALNYGQEGVEHFIDSKSILHLAVNRWLTDHKCSS